MKYGTALFAALALATVLPAAAQSEMPTTGNATQQTNPPDEAAPARSQTDRAMGSHVTQPGGAAGMSGPENMSPPSETPTTGNATQQTNPPDEAVPAKSQTDRAMGSHVTQPGGAE